MFSRVSTLTEDTSDGILILFAEILFAALLQSVPSVSRDDHDVTDDNERRNGHDGLFEVLLRHRVSLAMVEVFRISFDFADCYPEMDRALDIERSYTSVVRHTRRQRSGD